MNQDDTLASRWPWYHGFSESTMVDYGGDHGDWQWSHLASDYGLQLTIVVPKNIYYQTIWYTM